MNTLLLLTINGATVTVAVWILDRLFRKTTSTRFRRVWWLLIPLAFLVKVPLPVIPGTLKIQQESSSELTSTGKVSPNSGSDPQVSKLSVRRSLELPVVISWASVRPYLAIIWAIGFCLSFILTVLRVWQTHSFWSHQKECLDPLLLNLLGSCKADLQLRTRILLIVSEHASAPAILGGFRARLLVPKALVASLSHSELRCIFLHELAHFRAADLIWTWAFLFNSQLHWFNPFAHLASRSWRHFIEEAADERTLSLLPPRDAEMIYGTVLLKSIQHFHGTPPFGALAITESLTQLKESIMTIRNYKNRTHHQRPRFVALICSLLLFCVIFPVSQAQQTLPSITAATSATVPIDYSKVYDLSLKRISLEDWSPMVAMSRPYLKFSYFFGSPTALNIPAGTWIKLSDEKGTVSYAMATALDHDSSTRFVFTEDSYQKLARKGKINGIFVKTSDVPPGPWIETKEPPVVYTNKVLACEQFSKSFGKALETGDYSTVRTLWEQSPTHYIPELSYAISQDRPMSELRALHAHGAPLEGIGLFDTDPISVAAAKGDIEAIKWLHENGATLDSGQQGPESPVSAIDEAIQHGQVEALRLLLSYHPQGVSVYPLLDKTATPFRNDIIDLLFSSTKVQFNAFDGLRACRLGDAYLVKALLAHGLDVSAKVPPLNAGSTSSANTLLQQVEIESKTNPKMVPILGLLKS